VNTPSLGILHFIPDPLFIFDAEQTVLFMNRAAEVLLNITSDSAQGKSAQALLPPELTGLWNKKDDDKPIEWSSDERFFKPELNRMTTEDGTESTILYLRDITRLKKIARNQNEFTRIVSHDLRSPLTSIQGFASMLESDMVGTLNEKQKHFVSKILSGVGQLNTLVDNIQDAGRYDPESGFYELSRSHCDLTEMIRRIVENHLLPADKILAIKVTSGTDIPIISADAIMLERAIINLVDNAIKYTPSGGEVEVGAKRVADALHITVRDTGSGIAPEDQERIFERHVRLVRQEHKKVKGSGLGLFIVRSVARRHGGEAWVTSTLGNGSTFTLSLPLKGDNLVVST